MKFVFLFLFLFLTLFSCQKTELRKPTSVALGKLDLIEFSKNIQEQISNNKITNENCGTAFDDIIKKYNTSYPSGIDFSQVEVDGKNVLEESFKMRISLHSLLEVLNTDCRLKMKSVFYSIRKMEDMVGVVFYKDEQISADSIDFQKEKTPIFDRDAFHPYMVNPKFDSNKKFEFKNGDIMITKGISFVSSTISQIPSPKSLFSHIVFIHVDEKSKEVNTIESYVGKGVDLFPIEDALKNENARILILRPKNQELANKAANYIYDKVVGLKKKNKVILYDYDLNFKDNSKLSCEEVAYDAFNTVSKGSFIIPEIMSEIKLSDEQFLKRVGVKKGSMMVPTDMETDSRFELVADWTDFRIMRDSWRKDTVLSEMFRWTDDYKYQIHENLTSVAARVVWATRYIPGIWNMMAKFSGIPVDFTKDVPSKTIATMSSLKGIGNDLLSVVSKADEENFKSSGKWMSNEELENVLNQYRLSHPTSLEKVYRP